jgi:predicted DNA-binding antitoxin AbrB/MazE fold protein
MTTIIDAVDEGGLFRPIEKVDLAEGTHVEVRVPQVLAQRDPRIVAAKLRDVAARAPRRGLRESTGSDHDQILYGGKSQP